VSNHTLHIDLKSPYVTDVIKEYSINHFRKLENHPNPLLRPLLHQPDHRRIRRKWPEDLTN
jgi:pyrroloquinoline quinone (PQQ) biosynthesis protein C